MMSKRVKSRRPAKIFRARTREGYVCKVLAELLQNNIKTACFEVDDKGIRLCMMDNHRTILIKLELETDNFDIYSYEKKEKMFLGVNLSHFHRMLKSIKKRDSVELFIDDKEPNDLKIKVIPKENTRSTTSQIKIQSIQNIKTSLPEGYEKPIIVSSGEYQKMCKEMSSIGNKIRVSAKKFKIEFFCDAGDVMKRTTTFGNDDSDDEWDEKNETEKYRYREDFKTEQLVKITKLAGLGPNIKIYPKEGAPLLFKSNIGNLGKISIYIKSEELMKREACKSAGMDSDDEDY